MHDKYDTLSSSYTLHYADGDDCTVAIINTPGKSMATARQPHAAIN